MTLESSGNKVWCDSCGRGYTVPVPVEELAEKYRKEPNCCPLCELMEKKRRWSLYDDREKAAYLAGM
eukprot:12474239-Prorocentrum_lima.AAC.1